MDVLWEYVRAFLCGGALCLIGQVLIDRTGLTPARILVTYVVAGVVLGGVGLYEPLVEWGGAGATVPLTGFGYLLSKGVKKAGIPQKEQPAAQQQHCQGQRQAPRMFLQCTSLPS